MSWKHRPYTEKAVSTLRPSDEISRIAVSMVSPLDEITRRGSTIFYCMLYMVAWLSWVKGFIQWRSYWNGLSRDTIAMYCTQCNTRYSLWDSIYLTWCSSVSKYLGTRKTETEEKDREIESTFFWHSHTPLARYLAGRIPMSLVRGPDGRSHASSGGLEEEYGLRDISSSGLWIETSSRDISSSGVQSGKNCSIYSYKLSRPG